MIVWIWIAFGSFLNIKEVIKKDKKKDIWLKINQVVVFSIEFSQFFIYFWPRILKFVEGKKRTGTKLEKVTFHFPRVHFSLENP